MYSCPKLIGTARIFTKGLSLTSSSKSHVYWITLYYKWVNYNEIINFKEGDVINIIIKRGYQELNLTYNLKSLDEPWLEPIEKENKENINKAVKEDLERRYKFAPTIAEIKAKERSNIVKQLHGKNK